MLAFNLSVGPGRYCSRFCIELEYPYSTELIKWAAFRFDYNALHFKVEFALNKW
jgi:hypothetical protein